MVLPACRPLQPPGGRGRRIASHVKRFFKRLPSGPNARHLRAPGTSIRLAREVLPPPLPPEPRCPRPCGPGSHRDNPNGVRNARWRPFLLAQPAAPTHPGYQSGGRRSAGDTVGTARHIVHRTGSLAPLGQSASRVARSPCTGLIPFVPGPKELCGTGRSAEPLYRDEARSSGEPRAG